MILPDPERLKTPAMPNPRLDDRRALVAEDDYFLMDDLCGCLRAAGAVVVGPAPDIAEALALIATEPNIGAAVLDLNLRGEMAYPVADALLARGIPLVFSTGYSQAAIAPRYRRVVRCEKLAGFGAIAKALATAMNE